MDFSKLVEETLQENNVIGGPSSVMGPNVGKTASVVSGDNWNTGDQRTAKSIYGGEIFTRNGMKSYRKKNRKKK